MQNIFRTDVRHHILEANINFYKLPFVHPERILNEHDFIYMIEGGWKFGQNNEIFTLKENQILILAAGNRHLGLAPCSANTKTMYFTPPARREIAHGEMPKRCSKMMCSWTP